MRVERVACLAAAMFVFLTLGGCTGGAKSPALAKLAGSVKIDGQPLQSGTINFVPSDGKSATSGGTIKDGRFTARVPLGPMRILISSPKVTGQRKAYDTPDSPMIDIVEEALPAAYNTQSTLECVVTADKSDLNFDLKGAPAS